MDLALKGARCLVTGASKGIGRAIALSLAAEGADIALAARNLPALEEVATEIRAGGTRAHVAQVDGKDGESVERAVAGSLTSLGGLDVLINNLGGAEALGAFDEIGDDQWVDAYELNVMSVVRFVRACLPELKRAPNPRIINISSTAALQPGMFNPHYAAAKAAGLNLTKYLANVLAQHGITVNAVVPGPVHSDAWDRSVGHVARVKGMSFESAFASFEQEESAKVPLGRIGEGEDISALVTLLASPRSSWTTGAVFRVDGGKIRSIF